MKLSLSRINFFNIIAILIVFSIILSFFIYTFTQTLYDQKVHELEQSYYNHNKTLVKNEIERAVKRIETVKDTVYKKNKSILKDKVDYIHQLLSLDNTKDITKTLIKYKKELDLLTWKNKSSYFYIFDKNGKFLYYGGDQKYAKSNIFELAKSNKNLSTFIQKSMNNTENFGSYKWEKPDEKNHELFTKYVYTKKESKHEIYIAVGFYKNVIDKEINDLIFAKLKEDRFGDKGYGYFWIVGLDKIMKMHPKVEGKSINNLLTLDGQNLANLIIDKGLSNGGYVDYKWLNPMTNKVSEKTSYVKSILDLDLIIGTGFYKDELDKLLDYEKENLQNISKEYLIKIFLVLIILIIFSLIIARYLSLRIRQVEIDREENIHLLEQYRNLLDESSLVSRLDKNGFIIYVNKSFEKVSGYSKEELLGETHCITQHPDTPKSQHKNLWYTLSNGDIWKGILKNQRKNGESYYTSMTIIPIKNTEGEILRYISSAIDITKHIKNKTKLKNLFKTDSLTGLGNRVSLLNYIEKRKKIVLAFIDIDRFKEVNDSFNHTIGDKLIKQFGQRLFNHFSDKSYFLFRIQADVFAIVNDEKSDDIVKQEIKKFMQTIGKEKYNIDSNNFLLTYTCGLAANKDNLFAYANIALSEAKKKKQKIMMYDSSLKDIDYFKNNIQWVDRLNKAISKDNIIPHFQPIYNYKTGKIDKYEALMRIKEDDIILYPNDFLDIAKKTKIYPELTYKMIEKTLNKFSTNNLEFSLNLCIEDLMNEEVTTFLFNYAKKKNLFNRMVLEIVESEEMEDNNYIAKIIKKFKNEGTKISIDDFGSGYSNYEYLISLQADYLKIDGSITKLIVSDDRTLDVVKSLVDFARKSDIKVIAEFVSDEKIDKILREVGVDYAQGYYYGKPQASLI